MCQDMAIIVGFLGWFELLQHTDVDRLSQGVSTNLQVRDCVGIVACC